MVNNVVPFLMNLGDVIPARSKATLLNEMAMALMDCIDLYGLKKMNKLGKISRISICFWPIRLIPLSDTRACVCSTLLNKQEKINVGKFAQVPPPPNNVIQGADPVSFLDSLRSYNTSYLKKSKNYRRNTVIQEGLFNSSEIDYFKNFLLNQYNLSSFGEPYFLLEGDPISKSVNEIKIAPEIYEFVGLKDIKMIDSYADQITQLCEKWISKGAKQAEKIKGTTVDTSTEEKQLETLNKQLQAEKERDLQDSDEALLKGGKYKINDKSGEFYNQLNSFRNAVDRLKSGVSSKDLFTVEESVKEIDLKYNEIGNTISRYKTELAQLKKNLDRERYDISNLQKKKISDLENKIYEVKKQIEAKHQDLSSNLADTEDVIAQIKQEKQACLDNIESIKDSDLTDVQNFYNNYTIEIKTENNVVGIPIFIFYFVDRNTNRTTDRAPILPIVIEKGKPVRTKVTAGFRDKIADLMNKFTPVVNLVETEGEKGDLMNIVKNLDTRLEDAINDLRVRKILPKKAAEKAKAVINEVIW